jgi:hypothetical protein
VISAVPFVTSLLAEYIGMDQGRDQVGIVIFTGWMLIVSIMANITLQYAARGGRLLKHGLDQKALRSWIRLGAVGPLIWILALAVALLLNATITLVLDALILLLFLQEVPIGDGETSKVQ